MARWFVAGAAGMLGQDLCEVLLAAGHEVTRADLPGLDIEAPGTGSGCYRSPWTAPRHWPRSFLPHWRRPAPP